ncbi:unnamed protein product, partial [Didymodactylos carnosus]
SHELAYLDGQQWHIDDGDEDSSHYDINDQQFQFSKLCQLPKLRFLSFNGTYSEANVYLYLFIEQLLQVTTNLNSIRISCSCDDLVMDYEVIDLLEKSRTPYLKQVINFTADYKYFPGESFLRRWAILLPSLKFICLSSTDIHGYRSKYVADLVNASIELFPNLIYLKLGLWVFSMHRMPMMFYSLRNDPNLWLKRNTILKSMSDKEFYAQFNTNLSEGNLEIWL